MTEAGAPTAAPGDPPPKNTPPDWYRLGGVSPVALMEARIQAHHAAQWLARIARAALPACADDSHTSLGWDFSISGLTTHPLPTTEGPLRLGLSFAAGGIVLLGPREPLGLLPLDAVTDDEIRDSLTARAARLGIDPTWLTRALPYELPDHPVTEGSCYGFALMDREIREIGRWFANADRALRAVAADLAPFVATQPRVWPHHFDMGLLAVREGGDPERDPAIGLGLSPGDDVFAEPYYYANPYPKPPADTALPPVAAPSGWHTTHFTGIVLRGGDVVRAGDQKRQVAEVLKSAVQSCKTILDPAALCGPETP